MLRQLKMFVWETAEVILISLAIIIPIRYFLVQPFFVKGQSMEPTFADGDYLVVDEISFRLRPPVRGEVIVFKFPQDPSQYYIKRIIGLPGETVYISANRVRIVNSDNPNGFYLDESYLGKNQRTEGNIKIRVGADEYFVLGDNRLASYDSRRWGLVPKSDIVGRVWLRAWPFKNGEVFTAPSY